MGASRRSGPKNRTCERHLSLHVISASASLQACSLPSAQLRASAGAWEQLRAEAEPSARFRVALEAWERLRAEPSVRFRVEAEA